MSHVFLGYNTAKERNMRRIFGIFLFLLTLCACNLPAAPVNTPVAAFTQTPVSIPTDTSSPKATATAEPTQLPTGTPVPTETPIPTEASTETPTITPIPTYAILRGKVNAEKLSCRYGPGAPYLYLYGLVKGANQDVLGRTDTGAWVLTKSRGDDKSCWVKSEFLDLNGDVMSLEIVYPDKYTIPPSNQHYLVPYDVAAVRSGSQVVISWKSEALRPGDQEDASMVIYIVETWTCQNGQLTFNPIGTSFAQVTVVDEPGCNAPSHGRVYFQEKHGYTGPSEIPWP
jgi:hypothetical protein